MDIRFVSTLTADDEERVAGALLGALVALLDGLPIAYALRIETTSAKVFQRTNMSNAESETEADAESAFVEPFSAVSGHEQVQ
jgi:hypothetical protein